MYDIRQFGARGDGTSLDTSAIQAAIGAASAAGGGAVYAPPGAYLCGTLHLRSRVRLVLEHGAVLLGSPRIDDYRSAENGREAIAPGISALIQGDGLEDVAVEGGGTVDGQGAAFWTDERLHGNVRKPKDHRPQALVHLVRCRNVRLRDVHLVNSPCYTVWLRGCSGAAIDGILIDNPMDGPNTDGLDIDCCSDVRITQCAISAGDDCIALKSDSGRLGTGKACENVTVANCTLSSTACAVRVGYEGDAPIRNCCLNNLAIRDTDIGIDVVSILPADPVANPFIRHGAQIERIAFSNVVMDNVQRPLFLWLGNETDRPFGGCIRDIRISGLTASTNAAAYIGGTPAAPVESVSLRDICLRFTGHGEWNGSAEAPNVWGGNASPHGLIVRHARNVRVNGLQMDWTRATGAWRSQIDLCDADGFCLSGFHSAGFERVRAAQLPSRERAGAPEEGLR